jgi:hypothetical protein
MKSLIMWQYNYEKRGNFAQNVKSCYEPACKVYMSHRKCISSCTFNYKYLCNQMRYWNSIVFSVVCATNNYCTKNSIFWFCSKLPLFSNNASFQGAMTRQWSYSSLVVLSTWNDSEVAHTWPSFLLYVCMQYLQIVWDVIKQLTLSQAWGEGGNT